MSLDAGIKLGRYEIRSKIGEGGMGEVYHARDTQLGRDVAIKVLPSTYSQDRERLHRFEQEACAAPRVRSQPEHNLVAYEIRSKIGQQI